MSFVDVGEGEGPFSLCSGFQSFSSRWLRFRWAPYKELGWRSESRLGNQSRQPYRMSGLFGPATYEIFIIISPRQPPISLTCPSQITSQPLIYPEILSIFLSSFN